MPKTIDAAVTAKAILAENLPVFLVELELDSGTLYLCDAAYNTTFPSSGGNLYYAWGFSFDDIRNSVTGEVDRINFAFDNVDLSFRAFTDTDDFQGRRLTLRKIFADLLTSANYSVVLFTGLMSAPDANERAVSVTVSSPLVRLNSTIPRRRFQNNCHWKFDSTECKGGGASLAGELTGQVADAGGSTTTLVDAARTEADDYWNYGTVEMTDGTAANIGEIRPITDFVAATDTVTLQWALPAAIATGDTYTIRRGCNKTSMWCSVKHSNWINFGGFVGLPQRKV